MGQESQHQALQNLILAIKRCEQEKGLHIWEVTSTLSDALRGWASQERLEVQITVRAK